MPKLGLPRRAWLSRAAEPVYLEFDYNTLLPALFGEHDRHLARIEQLLGVSITSRGNMIAISGPANQAGVAKDALLSLHRRVRKGKAVDPRDFKGVYRLTAPRHD